MRTGRTSGVIRGGARATAGSAAAALYGSASARAAAPPPSVSSVILLRNMAGPPDSTAAASSLDELEREVGEECGAAYGPVEEVIIFECLPPAGALAVDDGDAVRVFVRFSDAATAARARAGLDGRFFGQCRIDAKLFDESRFAALDLAPDE